MTLYFVLDACAADRQVTLYDSFGHYHLARASDTLPAIGTELRGAPPFLGSSIRNASPTGGVFGMVFEVVDCGRDSALHRLHHAGPPAATSPVRLTPGTWPMAGDRHRRQVDDVGSGPGARSE